jgi:outer membrane receptor protein involved in Fe transport
MKNHLGLPLIIFALLNTQAPAQSVITRSLNGTVVTTNDEAVPGAIVTVRSSIGELSAQTDGAGSFSLAIPRETVTVQITGRNIVSIEKVIAADERANGLRIKIEYVIPKIHDGLVISASRLDPSIDRRNEAVYRDTLFSRDDQVFHTLDAGINAGQHEGGGKSLEIRRFGFNLDHGGVSGGLKVLVDNVQQNHGTQGHGQGYLGLLKSLTPELVEDVDILNGPFSAEYGDFSGLGVVHIRSKESLADRFTTRLQGGSFGSFRSFLGYSPAIKRGKSFIAYEGSRSGGPFINPPDYRRDNLTANYVRNLSETRSIGFKINLGRNDFVSSGQLPLDEVAAGRLDRFGFLDRDNGGRVRSGIASVYFRKESASGDVFKLDGFVARSLFDLYSNFTFFLNDAVNGDEIQQHDSRLQEGANAQLLRPFTIFGQRALLIAGANFHDNQINVGLNNSIDRAPVSVVTNANARVTNAAGYVQQGIDLLHGHLHLDAGLRYDYFRFRIDDRLAPGSSGIRGASRVQPKFNLSVTPADRVPLTIYLNYGRGISSQDARGVVQRPEGERISTTDFYQLGTSHNFKRFSLSADLFLIDRSNEQVYIPDDGSFEFKGPSRAYGFEVKSSIKLSRHVAFNGGVTKVMNAFYRGALPRVYVDSAPRLTGNAALTLAGWKGWSGSLRYRHIDNYRLDGEDPSIRASGFDVIDLSVTKQLSRRIDLNIAIDNLANKGYFETQNFFESRISPGADAVARIHGTPGYPFGVTVGFTFRLGRKE